MANGVSSGVKTAWNYEARTRELSSNMDAVRYFLSSPLTHLSDPAGFRKFGQELSPRT